MGKTYKRMNNKEEKSFITRIGVIYDIAKHIEDEWIGKEIVFQTEKTEVGVHLTKSNYMHLCGVRYSKGAFKYFEDCLHKKIDLKKVEIKVDGTTNQKLNVIGHFKELIKGNCRLGGSGAYLNVKYDCEIRTNKKVLSVKCSSVSTYYVPTSLMNITGKEVKGTNKVVKIIRVDLATRQKEVLYKQN